MTELLTRDLADFYRGVERMYGQSMTDEDARKCPYCKELAHMIYVEDSVRWIDEHRHQVEAAFQCTACRRFVVGGTNQIGVFAVVEGERVQIPSVHPQMPRADMAKYLRRGVQYWEPISPVGKTYDDVPPEIAAPADEAHRCFSIGAHRAAVLMGRAVIEAIAKHHDIDKGVLRSKIDQMGEKSVVRPQTVRAAHGIRDVGNDVAHGDFATADVTKIDAHNVLILMDVVLNDAFAGDHGLSRLLARADARDSGKDADE